MTIPEANAALDKKWTKLQKLPAWHESAETRKAEVIRKAIHIRRQVHYGTVMDLTHLKNSELEKMFQYYKGRVVLRSDIVKRDCGNVVFTEQGASASHVTAAKVLDVCSRWLLGCFWTSKVIYTQVKMKDERELSSSFGRGLTKDLDQITEQEDHNIGTQLTIQ